MTAQGLEAIALGADAAGAPTGNWRLWARIRAAGSLLRPGMVVLTMVVAAFLLAMILVLQLQLQAARIATVNELERELAQLQRVRSALLVEAATASDLPRIQQRAVELMMHPAEPTVITQSGPGSARRISPAPIWSDPAPPDVPHWRERFWHALMRWTGRGPADP